VISLDAPKTVRAGDAISGTVRGADRVRIFIRRTTIWDERSGGVPVDRDEEGIVTESGPFVLPALRGPLTFRGEHVELRWSIVAESLAGAGDHAERPFALVAPETATYEREATGGYRDPPTETTVLEPDFGEQWAEGPRRRRDFADEPLAQIGAKVARFFTMVTGGRTGATNVTLDVSPSRVRPGGEIVAKLAFVVNEETVVESITLELLARECGIATRQEEHLFHTHVETVSDRARLDPGPYTYERRLAVPDDAPPCWLTRHYGVIGVEWFVRATIQIDGHVDDVSDFVIGVAPF